MALSNPPINDTTLENDGRFRQTWVKWLRSITREVNSGYNGSFTDNDGNTVTVVNGKITDIT